MAGNRVVKLKRQTLEPSEKSRARQLTNFCAALAVALVAFVAAIRWVAADRNGPSSTNFSDAGLYYALSMAKQDYLPGERIQIGLNVTNISSDPIKLSFDNNLEYDLTIQREQNIGIAQLYPTVWQLSLDSGHRPVHKPHNLTIEPGESKTFEGVWPQVDLTGKPVAPGRYTIIGSLLAKDRATVLKLHGTTNH